ncbi:MAG: hypothetical protein GXY83_30745 [Rhodopirellula sp.]|nr:hypothetical protein [Rhodopirellula sp.]
MKIHMYAVRMEADQLVAAEIDDATAARLIDSGQPLLLATESELHTLARRQGLHRTVLFRRAAGRSETGAARTLVDAA